MPTEVVYKYVITPRCTTPYYQQLFLTSNAEGAVSASTENPNWSYQVWILQGQRYGEFQLQNSDNGLWLATVQNRAAVQLFQKPDGPAFLWEWEIGSSEFGAIQSQRDTSMNLNVSGDPPYQSGTIVLAWDWAGGQPNEIWQINPYPAA